MEQWSSDATKIPRTEARRKARRSQEESWKGATRVNAYAVWVTGRGRGGRLGFSYADAQLFRPSQFPSPVIVGSCPSQANKPKSLSSTEGAPCLTEITGSVPI